MGKLLGKGTLYIMSAEVVFIVSSYIMHLVLGRHLGPDLYGVFGVVLYLSVIIRAVLLTAIPRAVAKYTAENHNFAISIKNEALKIQTIFSLLVFALYFSLSGIIGNLLHDSDLVKYLRISAFIIPLTALYSVFLHSLNGLRRFEIQSAIMVVYYIARVVIVLALVLIGFSVSGAVLGLVLAALIGLLAGWYCWGFESTEYTFQASRLLRFAIPIAIFSLASVLLMNMDLLFVKAMLVEKVMTGFYTSAKAIARMPYFIFGALSITLLPSVSRSISMNDINLTRKYINQSLRYVLILLTPVTFIISGTANNLVQILYSSKFAEAGTPLGILIFGFLFFSIFMILSTIINASGKPKISMSFAAAMIPVNIILNLILIPRYQLMGAALATSISFLFGPLIAGVYVYKKFKTLMSPLSLLRISMASVIIYIISIRFPISGIALIGQYIILSALYIVLLFLFGEIQKEDIRVAKDIFASVLSQ